MIKYEILISVHVYAKYAKLGPGTPSIAHLNFRQVYHDLLTFQNGVCRSIGEKSSDLGRKVVASLCILAEMLMHTFL